MIELPTIKICIEQISRITGRPERIYSTALLDTGTMATLISESLLKTSNFTKISLNQPLRLTNAVNQTSENLIFHKIYANIIFPRQNKTLCNRELFVVNYRMKWPIIVGMNILANKILKLTPSVQVNNLTTTSQIDTVTVPQTPIKSKGTFLLANGSTIIQPMETQFVNCKVNESKRSPKNTTFYTSASPSLSNSGCILHNIFENNRSNTKVTNLSKNQVYVENNALLGTLSNEQNSICDENDFEILCNALIKVEEMSKKDQAIHKKELNEWRSRRNKLLKTTSLQSEIDIIIDNTPNNYKKEFKALLQKYDAIFSRSQSDSGFNPTFAVKLTFKDGASKTPVFSKPYKLERETSIALEKKVLELIDAGILEKTSSSWNSPAIGIKKRGGGFRLVNNYSTPKDFSVNARLSTTNFPIPSIRNLNQTISTAIARLTSDFPEEKICMASLDLRNAFYNLCIAAEDRDITAFIISDLQLRYKKLSMGLAVSPSEFQMFMHFTFQEHLAPKPKWQFLSYLDDYFLISCESAHLQAIDFFFSKCLEENILLSISKCTFFRPEVKFLGMIINSDGFAVEKAKIDALIAMPYPKTQKQAQKYMGSMQYFARHIPRLSMFLSPIASKSASKDFKLDDAMKFGIDKLRETIKNGIGTHHLDYSNKNGQKIILAVDTSLTATGFALGNANFIGNKISNIRLSHFGSKKLDPFVSLLSSRSRELIGLSTALTAFRDLISESMHIVALVDHQSLQNAKSNKQLGKTSSHTRSRNALANILNFPNLEIRFLPNTNSLIMLVDGLSRSLTSDTEPIEKAALNPTNTETNTLITNQLDFTNITLDSLVEEQKADDFIEKLRFAIAKQPNNITSFQGKEYTLKNNIVCLITQNQTLLSVIPQKMANQIIDELHLTLLHTGEERIRATLLNSPIYIPKARSIIKRTCNLCLWCQLSTPGKFYKGKSPNYMIKPGLAPFSKTYIDLMDISAIGGPQFILSFVDGFSSFADIDLLRRKTMEELVPKLVLLINKWGLQHSSEICSDNGREFINAGVEKAFKYLNITHRKISVWNSRANYSERFHRELRRALKPLEPKKSDIDFKAKLALSYYNNLPKIRLGGRSPLQLLTGATPTQYLTQLSPLDRVPQMEFTEPTNDDFAQWHDHLVKLHNNFAIRQIDLYNSRPTPSGEFKVNDIVMIITPSLNIGHAHHNKAIGPFVVTGANKNTYDLVEAGSNKKMQRNGRFLKRLKVSNEDAELIRKQVRENHITNKILPTSAVIPARINKLRIKIAEKEPVESEGYNLRKRK